MDAGKVSQRGLRVLREVVGGGSAGIGRNGQDVNRENGQGGAKDYGWRVVMRHADEVMDSAHLCS